MGAAHRILLATDFSDPSREAFLAAIAAARRDDATLLIAHVAESLPSGLAKPEQPAPRSPLPVGPSDLLDYWAVEARKLAVNVETRKLEGLAWREIVDLAAREKVASIFVGTHGRTGLMRALVGSVAQKIVGHAPCSVTVVRPPVH